MANTVTQNLLLYKLGASNVFFLANGHNRDFGLVRGPQFNNQNRCIHNCLNYCVYFCNIYAVYKCGRRLQIGCIRHKTLTRFHGTGKIRTGNFANQNHLRFTGMVTTTAGCLGNSVWPILPGKGKTVYSLRWNKECDVIYVFFTLL